MKKRISVILAWILAGIGVLAFFLPWVRPASEAHATSVLDVANQLNAEEDSFFNSWIGMRKDERRVFWQRPTTGLSGYQILLLESDGGVQAREAQEWLSAVFGDRSGLGRWVNVLPIVAMLLTAAFLSPRKPVRKFFGVGALLLLALYLWGRWRLDVTYTDRIVAETEIGYGFWITLYAMIALAILGGLKFLFPKGKW